MTAPFADVLAEIDAEVARRRQQGDITPEFEARLDEEFARFAPVSFRDRSLDAAIDAVERASFIDIEAPTDASRKPFELVKVGVRKATGWYQLHVARQITSLGVQVARSLRLTATQLDDVDRRLRHIERTVGAAGDAVHTGGADLAEWTGSISGHLKGATGRVLVGDITDEQLVRELVTGDVDAYGVGPAVEGGTEFELREESLTDHLDELGTGALAAIVMAGAVDWLPVPAKIRLAQVAADRLARKGTLIVISSDPEKWADSTGVVSADLAPGRPLHAETWEKVLADAGLVDVGSEAGGTSHLIVGTAPA